MKRAAVFLVVLATAVSLTAGVSYEFKSVTEGRGGGELSGIARVEGKNMRLEFASGDRVVFQNGSVVISKDGGRTMSILDTKKKSYYELSLEDTLNALGSVMNGLGGMFKMSITNPVVKVTEAGDGGAIEGYPTKKYVIDSSYDMLMSVMGMKNEMNVVSKTESWNTDKLDREAMSFVQQKGFKTGVEDLDKLIAAESTAIKGFPLKQVRTQTSTSKNGKSTTNTTTTTISNVKKESVSDSEFEIPGDYKQVDGPLEGLNKIK
jgi:hypothetical protein